MHRNQSRTTFLKYKNLPQKTRECTTVISATRNNMKDVELVKLSSAGRTIIDKLTKETTNKSGQYLQQSNRKTWIFVVSNVFEDGTLFAPKGLVGIKMCDSQHYLQFHHCVRSKTLTSGMDFSLTHTWWSWCLIVMTSFQQFNGGGVKLLQLFQLRSVYHYGVKFVLKKTCLV